MYGGCLHQQEARLLLLGAHHSEEEASPYGLRQVLKPQQGSRTKEGGTEALHLSTLSRVANNTSTHIPWPGILSHSHSKIHGRLEFLILDALCSVKPGSSIVEKCIGVVWSLTSPKESSGHAMLSRHGLI